MTWYVSSTPIVGLPQNSQLSCVPPQYKFQSEFGIFRDSVIPDPRLVALGVKFGSLEEFVEKEVKPRYA
jgi:hypothetical protein